MKALCSFMEDDKYDDKLDALRYITFVSEAVNWSHFRALQRGMNGGDDVATLSSYDADIKSMIDMKTFVGGWNERMIWIEGVLQMDTIPLHTLMLILLVRTLTSLTFYLFLS